jgi:hypothetical protein
MEELLTAGYYPYLHLDNPEILIKYPLVHRQVRELKGKVKKTSDQIREMMARGISREEIIDQSVELITSELRPSRFGYVCAVIASEFPKTFLKWVKIDELSDQVLDVLRACEPVFNLLKFKAHLAEQHSVYLTVTSFIGHYLKRKNRSSKPKAKSPAAQKTAEIVQAAATGKAAEIIEPVQTVPSIQPVTPVQALVAVKNDTLVQIMPAFKSVTYFNSELLEKTVFTTAQLPASLSGFQIGAHRTSSKKSAIMANKQYLINKGINKSLVFKGLKAQYIGYMGLGLLLDLLFYAVLYMAKVNTYITLLLTMALGALISLVVYHLNATYGEHGLSKSLAKRKTPKIIRTISRRIFR